MATLTPVRPVHSLRWQLQRLRLTPRRTLFVSVAVFGLFTVAAGAQLSRVFAPGWSPIRHAIVNAGGQLLALVGLFIAALHVEKQRGEERDAPPPSHDHSDAHLS